MSVSQEQTATGSFFDELGLDLTKLAASDPTASILPRSVEEIEGHGESADFYRSIRDHLEGLGYQVKFDVGVEGTAPESSDLIVGHSTAVPRLLDAPAGSTTLALGMRVPSDKIGAGEGKIDAALVHSSDTPPRMGQSLFSPSKEHYVLTDAMKGEMKSLAKKHGAIRPWSQRAMSWMRSKIPFLFEE
jgi:hypothetical protein